MDASGRGNKPVPNLKYATELGVCKGHYRRLADGMGVQTWSTLGGHDATNRSSPRTSTGALVLDDKFARHAAGRGARTGASALSAFILLVPACWVKVFFSAERPPQENESPAEYPQCQHPDNPPLEHLTEYHRT